MADAKAKGKEQAPAEEAPKSNKKLIIILAIVGVIAIGASIGVTILLMGPSGDAPPAAQVPAEPVKEPALYLEIKPQFVLTYDVGGKQRYMQVFVSAMGREKKALDAIELHMPVIRSEMIQLFGSQDFVALQTIEGKEALREACLKKINEIVKKETGAEIEQVLFTNFVMQ